MGKWRFEMAHYRKNFGDWGEDIAVRYLSDKGYVILQRNFRAARGEIDIIARDNDCIVFVEVKTGSTHKYGPPEDRITMSKRKQLYKIANEFINQNPKLDANFRFDAVIIDGSPEKHEIRHYPNAFYF